MSTTEQGPSVSPAARAPTPRARSVRWAAVVVVVATIGVAAVFGARLDKDPNLVDSPLIGTPASERSVPYLEKPGMVSLKELRGQVVVVNFWASWCVACREEHPALIAAADAYRNAGVTFVGVDYQDRKNSAVAFLDEMGRGKTYRYLADPGSRLAIDFGVYGVPETFVVDRAGVIVAKITGASTLPLLSSVLDDVLAGREPTKTKSTGPVQPRPGR